MSINKKYNFDNFKISLRTDLKTKFIRHEFENGVWSEEDEKELKSYIENGQLYSLSMCYDGGIRYIDIGCEYGFYYVIYFDESKNESLSLVNTKYLGSFETIGICGNDIPLIGANEKIQLLFDVVLCFLKTGEKLETGVWKSSDWDGLTI